jgi:ABC-2 type transport system ATP-binding protein
MISVQNITKRFGPVTAVDGVSFDVEKGEILGFLGPNAAGKTTTMRIITCYFPPTSGTVKVAGLDVLDNSLEVRRKIGYMPESVPLYLDMPVQCYLDFVASIKGVPGKEREKQVKEVMGQCGLADVEESVIGKLSKGFRQRVGLAQALIGNPEIIILDEPTVGLDPKQIIEIRELIKSFAEKATIILSTHILPEASMVCNRVVIINDGKIVAIDTPDNLTKRLQKNFQVSVGVEGKPERISELLRGLRGVVSVEPKGSLDDKVFHFIVESERDLDLRREIARTVVQNDMGLIELRAEGMTLEDIFIKLVTDETSAKEVQ